jgi:hypothetical protein
VKKLVHGALSVFSPPVKSPQPEHPLRVPRQDLPPRPRAPARPRLPGGTRRPGDAGRHQGSDRSSR